MKRKEIIKIMLTTLFLSNSLFGTEINKNLSKVEIKKKEKYKKLLTTKKLVTLGLIKPMKDQLFLEKSKFYDIVRKGSSDENLKEALYLYYNFSEIKKINKKIVKIPKYNDFFEELKKSTDKGNVLASYIGLNILENQFLINKKNSIAKKYLRDLSTPLAKEGYPLGLFWYGKSYLEEWSPNSRANYKRSIKSYERAITNIDLILEENRLNKKDKERLERFKQIVLLSKGKSSGLLYLQTKSNNGEKIKIKRKLDLSKYKKGKK